MKLQKGVTPPPLGTCWEPGLAPDSERASSHLPRHQVTKTAPSRPFLQLTSCSVNLTQFICSFLKPAEEPLSSLLTAALPLNFPRARTGTWESPSFCRTHPTWTEQLRRPQLGWMGKGPALLAPDELRGQKQRQRDERCCQNRSITQV